ncbi:hypothetical protein [Sphingomonas crocodyli]|uniref:Glycosyltransferase RgtA/B/C/D-like domain-containing protein n=1 Tax=Sphingomonas crocodyli TaxID=1979270 RepID=A0A437M5B4_9SPHN|nr:hypothetical protein [Sphingomonas crocodyli]RVT92766.1 hypothetical protein EOD43_02260 [Sphingomonas crocodyli]
MFAPFRSAPLSTRLVVGGALAIGLVERIGWALARANGSATGEAYNVAAAIGNGRGFADAFQIGQGATAHLMPLPPMVAGGVYATLGVGSKVAEAVLLGWALLLTFATYALFACVARRIGVGRKACVAGFAFLCVAPIFTTTEAFDFRAWEGGMTMSAAGLFLLLALRFDASQKTEKRAMGRGAVALLAALPALILFLQPMIGLAACVASILLLWRRRDAVRPIDVAPFLIAFALLFGGWTARNVAVMGAPIVLRDNLGLELAVANHAGAVNPADPKAAFEARLGTVHPYVSTAAFDALRRAGGEIAYAKALGAQTRAWMAAHPGDTARLWAGHLRQIVLPAPWQFRTAHGRALPIVRAVLLDIVTVAGLIGLGLLLRDRDRRRRALYLAPFVLLPILLYVPFQPILRYIWLVYAPLGYCAAFALERLVRRQ